MDGETLPMLADLLRSHLASISYINSILVTLPDGTQVLRPQVGYVFWAHRCTVAGNAAHSAHSAHAM